MTTYRKQANVASFGSVLFKQKAIVMQHQKTEQLLENKSALQSCGRLRICRLWRQKVTMNDIKFSCCKYPLQHKN